MKDKVTGFFFVLENRELFQQKGNKETKNQERERETERESLCGLWKN